MQRLKSQSKRASAELLAHIREIEAKEWRVKDEAARHIALLHYEHGRAKTRLRIAMEDNLANVQDTQIRMDIKGRYRRQIEEAQTTYESQEAETRIQREEQLNKLKDEKAAAQQLYNEQMADIDEQRSKLLSEFVEKKTKLLEQQNQENNDQE